MPYTTRRLPPTVSVDPRETVVTQGPNVFAFLSFALSLVVPVGIFLAGFAALFVGFKLDFWSGLMVVLVAAFASVGAISAGIRGAQHAAGSRAPEARRTLALVGLGLGYADLAAVSAFVIWTLIRSIEAIHLGG